MSEGKVGTTVRSRAQRRMDEVRPEAVAPDADGVGGARFANEVEAAPKVVAGEGRLLPAGASLSDVVGEPWRGGCSYPCHDRLDNEGASWLVSREELWGHHTYLSNSKATATRTEALRAHRVPISNVMMN